MALKFIQSGEAVAGGSGSGTYDHNLLVNRGMPDQHTIESVTGLRTTLDRKYEKPFSGIPKTDLAFNVATLYDIDVFRNTDLADVANDLAALSDEILDARGGLETLKTYIDTKVSYADWSGNGGVGGGSGSNTEIGYPIYEEYTAAVGQTVFPLTKTFQMGSHQLEVYLDGIRMLENDDYQETDDHTVTFFWTLEGGERLLFLVRAIINSGLHEEYIATVNQTRFTLNQPYGIYQNLLQVFRNGVLQRKGRDYRELDDHTVEFIYSLQENDLVTFHQAGATDPIGGTILESEIGRIKINQGYITMMLQDAVQTEQTDYMDMYVDTFITDHNIDSASSFGYLYQDKSILVNDVQLVITTNEDFMGGVINDVDVQTYLDEIVLRNLPGGSEAHNFAPYVQVTGSSILNELLPITTKQHQDFYFYSEELPSGQCVLRVKTGDTIKDLNATDGYFFGLSGSQDSKGNVRLVYHEQGGTLSHSRIHYLELDALLLIVTFSTLLSDLSQDAIRPDIFIDTNDKSHIVFTSKRINADYFNIDYVTVEGGTISGFKDITTYTNMDALNARIVVTSDLKARIVFESINFDGVTKNIRYTIINQEGIREFSLWLTQSTTYDNTMPDIAIDILDETRVVWKSKRLSATYGVDYCQIPISNIPSVVRSIATGEFICDHPMIEVDYEGISHILFNANIVRSDHQNIAYSYVYPDGTIAPMVSVADVFGIQFTDARLSVYGDKIVASALGDTAGYKLEKSLANYTGIGGFDYIYDSKAEQSTWDGLVGTRIDSNIGTNAVLECRASDDQVMWSDWVAAGTLPSAPLEGRYLHMRNTLSSTDPNVTPIVTDIMAMLRPGFIEVESIPKSSIKDVNSVILLGKFEGEVHFAVSRDGGVVFTDGELDTAINLLANPQGNEIVLKAKILDGSRLTAWGIVW